jgi:hypothetical protein
MASQFNKLKCKWITANYPNFERYLMFCTAQIFDATIFWPSAPDNRRRLAEGFDLEAFTEPSSVKKKNYKFRPAFGGNKLNIPNFPAPNNIGFVFQLSFLSF